MIGTKGLGILGGALLIACALLAAPGASASEDCSRFAHLCENPEAGFKSHLKGVLKSPKLAPTGKSAVIIRGLAGEIVSPMIGLAAELRAKGYSVRLASFNAPGDLSGASVVVGHSMGIFPALASCAPKVITIDIPFWAGEQQRCARSSVGNFHTLGHPLVYGAVNVRIGGLPLLGHVAAPSTAQEMILSML